MSGWKPTISLIHPPPKQCTKWPRYDLMHVSSVEFQYFQHLSRLLKTQSRWRDFEGSWKNRVRPHGAMDYYNKVTYWDCSCTIRYDLEWLCGQTSRSLLCQTFISQKGIESGLMLPLTTIRKWCVEPTHCSKSIWGYMVHFVQTIGFIKLCIYYI